jgi:ATP-dependent RNA helicase DeaD
MGFREDMEFILGAIPGVHRTCLFSATMSREVRSIADRFLAKNAFTISIGKANTSALNISHQFAVVHQRDKYQALKRILDALPGFYGIVFCTTKIETQDISDKLIKDGYHADCMHGDLSQSQREKTLARFRHGAVRILLATDVAARGIDVSDLTHVVHYHLPDDIENYTHRSGRTARAGKSGISVVLLNVKEFYKIKRIEQTSGVKFERYMIPKGEDLVKNLIQKIMDEVELHVTSEEPWQLNAVEALSKFPSEKLAATLVSKMAGNIGTDPELLPDLNVYDRGRGGEEGAGDGYGQAKLFISLGAKDRLNVQSMKELVVEMSGIQPAQISSVIIKDTYSFLLVSPDIKTKVVEFMNGGSFGDRPIRIEETTPEQNSGRGRSGGGDRYGDRGGDRGGFSRGGDRGGYKRDGGSSGGSRYRGDSSGSSDRYRGDSTKSTGSSSDRPKRPSYGKDKPDSFGGKKRGGGGSNSGFKTRY